MSNPPAASAQLRPARTAFAARPRAFRTAQIAGVLLLLPVILTIDGRAATARHAGGQWASNIVTLAYFLWIWTTSAPRLRRLMVIGLFVAAAGECFFSLWVGMYEYRLANVPLYVPPGHTIVYAAAYYFTREPWVRRNARLIRPLFFAIAAAFSTYWFAAAHDLYGFLCFAVFTVIIAVNRDSRLFFLTMFLLVLYLELIGTSLGCWHWHAILLNKYPAIPSGNPPAGIAVFYFGFDVACLGVYMLSDLRRRARYDAQKAHRRARARAAAVAAPTWATARRAGRPPIASTNP